MKDIFYKIRKKFLIFFKIRIAENWRFNLQKISKALKMSLDYLVITIFHRYFLRSLIL